MAMRAKAAVLAGDIGGTKTRLRLYRVEGASLVSRCDKHYASRFQKSRRCRSRFSKWRPGESTQPASSADTASQAV
jgi:glucokinase